MLLLLPSLLLASELDNLVRPLFPSLALTAEGEAAPDPVVLRLATVEFAITTALLRPVLEEFFFRGVIQQGVVAHLGALGGVAYTAALFGLVNGGLELPFGPDRAASAAAQAAFAGLLLGLLRQASGSLLAPIVASCALESLGLASTVLLAAALPIPGYNAPGPHTPLSVLAPCAASVSLGAWLLLRRG
jgi:membrane protease YdiL (CAAX protease family)